MSINGSKSPFNSKYTKEDIDKIIDQLSTELLDAMKEQNIVLLGHEDVKKLLPMKKEQHIVLLGVEDV